MKRTEIPDIDVSIVDKVINRWRSGELVAMPTETVYGLAADATQGEAVARIYSTKARPQFNPLIVHVASAAMAQRYVAWSAQAETLAAACWPGPLTLVLPRLPHAPISPLVSAGGDTIAIRCPAHPVAQRLIAAYGEGVAAPSANRSGRVSPTTAQHVRDEFGDGLLVVDGGPCRHGIESTVVDISGAQPALLRPGSITRAMLEAWLGPLAEAGPAIRSPGQMLSHYAPNLPVRLNAAAVAADEALLAFGPNPLVGAAVTLNLSATGDLIEAAANLFSMLRALDDARWRGMAVMPIPAIGVGEAIADRLRRAAARRA